MHDSYSCDPGSIPGQCNFFIVTLSFFTSMCVNDISTSYLFWSRNINRSRAFTFSHECEYQRDWIGNIQPLPTREHCWCSGIMQDSHSCDPGSIPGQCNIFIFISVQVNGVSILHEGTLTVHGNFVFLQLINVNSNGIGLVIHSLYILYTIVACHRYVWYFQLKPIIVRQQWAAFPHFHECNWQWDYTQIDCLFNGLFKPIKNNNKKSFKFRVTRPLWTNVSVIPTWIPPQRAGDAINVPIWWRTRGLCLCKSITICIYIYIYIWFTVS